MWQLLLIVYFILSTINYLLRRVLAKKLGDHNRLINAIFFMVFLLPEAVILGFYFPHNLNVGVLNVMLLLGGSIIWPLLGLASFQANKHVDVGIFAVINNVSPIFTLAIALPFLHEKVSTLQVLGIGLLILSGVLAASSQMHKRNRTSTEGILLCLLSAFILGVATAFERFMLGRVDFGTYLIYGWGSQIVWAAILAGKELKKMPLLFAKSAEIRKILITWGSTRALASVCFISALKLTGAAIISAATDFLSVAVVIAAYFYLKERDHMIYKLFATAAGFAGLLLIA
ncbi:MAG TPA: EamA family transporter [Candidatus Acidoferrales bacterium]|nr:EamA family transporter [Candidatus Acidoferrales bacterium]